MKRRELLKTTLVLPFAGLLKAVPVTTAVDFVDVPCGVPVRKGMKYPHKESHSFEDDQLEYLLDFLDRLDDTSDTTVQASPDAYKWLFGKLLHEVVDNSAYPILFLSPGVPVIRAAWGRGFWMLPYSTKYLNYKARR